MTECEKYVGRLYDLCTGVGHDGRPTPEPVYSAAFRASVGLPPIHSRDQVQESQTRTDRDGIDWDSVPMSVPLDFGVPVAYTHEEMEMMRGIPQAGYSTQFQAQPNLPERKTGKAGTKLKEIFASLKISLPVCAPCQDAVLKMDRLSPAECRLKKDEFMEGIRKRAEQVTTASYIFGAVTSVLTGLAFRLNPLDPISSMYDLAVSQAEEELQNEQHGG